MNVMNTPLMGFKEFEAYQPQQYNPSNPMFARVSNRGSESIHDIINAVASKFGAQNDVFEASPLRGFQGANSRMFAEPFQRMGRGHGPRHQHQHQHPVVKGRGEPQGAANHFRLDSRSFSKSLQSTELTIQTKDGDTVTIRIKERSVQKEESSVDVKNGSGEKGEQTEISQRSKSASSQTWDLNAIFNGETVSDVSFESEWTERSKESIKVNHTADGITTEADYRSKSYTAGSLEFEVDGTLDADELEAIGDLIKGVDELSQTFFEGDMTQAFEQALQLGYDKSEIAGYALELKEREVNYAEQQYRAVGELNQPAFPKGLFKPISKYADSLKTLDELDKRRFDGQLLERLMKRVDENRKDEEERSKISGSESDRFSAFNLEMLRQVQTLQLSYNL